MNVAVSLDHLRPAAAPISAGLAAFAEIGEAEWDALLGQALDPNPFHGRLVVTAHAASGLLPERLRFIAVRGGAGLEALHAVPSRRQPRRLAAGAPRLDAAAVRRRRDAADRQRVA